ncbi:3-hydroxyacyl-[acyl-carrier-protein] dehydratase FabZ [Candidatus Woesearchaeota archaeon]|nr:3-hydroxyacyl-[acyl-carrier-protein] dehydratase FabZ [Candidatus Woesearchaeota archaeon]
MKSIDKFKGAKGQINRENIKKIIPYDEPFLMIDRILKLNKKEIVAIKDVKKEEDYFKGHFKGFPIMPGALIVEGLGQAATLLVRYNIKNHEQKDILAYKIRSAKFFRPTFPGHTLRFEAKLLFIFRNIAFVNANVFRKEKLVSKVKMILAIVDKKRFRERYSKKIAGK